MNPQTFEEAAQVITGELADLVVSKQHDYGKGNILEFGEQGILVRANDKFARLKNLILNSNSPMNEPKMDTWRDIAGYAIVALMLERGWFELPMEEEE